MGRIRVVEVVESAAEGTGKHVCGLLRGLDPARFQTALVASTRREPDFGREMDRLREEGVDCHRLQMRREIRPGADTSALWRLVKLFRRLQPDVVHGHGSKGGFLARAAARALGIQRSVYTPHCFAFAGDVGACQRRLYRGAERRAGKWTARLIAVSSQEARLAAEERIVPAQRVVMIPNGLGEEEFVPPAPPERLRDELGMNRDRRTVGFVGRLWPQKGADLLLGAFPRIAAACPDCQLLIVGDGPDRAALEALAESLGIRKKAIFVGKRDDIPSCLQLMDVVALPSRWESGPYVVLEAMAAGKPIVSTRVGGIPEILEEGRCGELVNRDDVEGLARAVVGLLQDGARAAELTAAAAARVRESYRLSDTVSRTAAVYDELVNEAP